MSNDILHSRIQARFYDIFETPPEVPIYIQDNLSHKMRPYQEEAIQHFIYTQRSSTADVAFNHVLFHMATGSGKTLVLAAVILYMFKEHNHQNFIFFVDSDAIIKKTVDNLTNSSSSKYLFAKEGIVIEGERINIQVVDTFPLNQSENTIYLKLTTIQKLHLDLTNPREEGLTFESLEELKLVLLADEAHHINALTRNNKKKLNTKEIAEKTWEYTVSKLLRINTKNRLIEFTATIDLSNDALFNKYNNKIVYQYDLKRFMEEGYSKNVVLLRANEDDNQKMINAMLLSQYRKYIAKEHKIDLKPIILFKSNKIAISKNANNAFFEIVKNLTVSLLKEIVKHGLSVNANPNSIWNKMFSYYNKQNLEKVVRDLQWDFTEETTINANDASFLSENNSLILNTLEDKNNPIRTIFAVAKLNEGWDVLNLYDIVRISEGATNSKATTDSEAQLIGRGARYYPFKYNGDKAYKRRFDMSPSDLKIIETLHYHTINENQYIKNLQKSMEAANIQVKEDEYYRLEAKIKAKIKQSDWFRNGKIYINKLIPTTPDDYKSLEDYNITRNFEFDYEKSIEQLYGSKKEVSAAIKRHEKEMKINKRLLQKAIQRRKFFHFNNLQKYIPSITSVREFIESPNFLGDISIKISLPSNLNVDELTPRQQLAVVEKFLGYVEQRIRSNYMKLKGSPVFEGISMPEIINDYIVEINKVTTMSELVSTRNMRDHDWYIYDRAIVNNLESDFIDFINDYVDQLKQKYKDVYLIRNERKVKIVEIDGVRGFMPDFLLYMKDANYTYQVFLEPKGAHLLEQDKWKEEFLVSLSSRTDIEILSENEVVRLIGIKFYSDDTDKKNEFRNDLKAKLLN